MSLYEDSHNKESWNTIAYDWDYAEFVDHLGRIIAYSKVEEARRKDAEELAKRRQSQQEELLGGING